MSYEFRRVCKKHKTQKKAAEILGFSQSMISSWLNKRYEITPNTAFMLEKRSNGEILMKDQLPEIFGSNSCSVNE